MIGKSEGHGLAGNINERIVIVCLNTAHDIVNTV